MGYIPTMPYMRLFLAVVISCLVPLFALGQAPAPTPVPMPAPTVEPPTPAEQQLDVAIIKVRALERIAAKIEQDVDMLNQKFKLEGNYYKDTGHRVRLQLDLVGLGDTKSTMLQVCDGKVLWDYQKVLGMQSYRKREITQILKKLDDPNLDAMFRGIIIANMGFGGPEAMLAGLRKAVKFDQVEEKSIDVGGTSVEVFDLGGTWKDRTSLLGPNDRPLSPTDRLPPYIPSNVHVFVGKVDGWPYKIRMKGNAQLLLEETRSMDPISGRPVGQPRKPPKVEPSEITLTYKLLPASEISDALFYFSAPADMAATNVKDETEEFIAMLDQYIQMETNRKKAEAAKAEGEPLLKAPPIEVRPETGLGGIGTVPTPETPAPK